MYITLPPTTSTLLTERLLLGKLEYEMFNIMYVVRIARISDTSTILDVGIVSEM
jgi:hypothetical protein